MSFEEAMRIVNRGYEDWAARHPNWARKIDGTPIPNDLQVCIAVALVRAEQKK